MSSLSIDIETYSSADLGKCGVYKYAESEDFEILLFAYCFDKYPVRIVDLVNFEAIPEEVLSAIQDPAVLKTAHNAQFERVCLSKHLGVMLDPAQWECTMVKAAMTGMPFSLGMVAEALKLKQNKDTAGKALIRYFSLPCKPSKTNGGRTRNYPEHDSEKWEAFKKYCIQDVVVEREIANKLSWFRATESEKKLWWLDQRINDEGVMLDKVFVQKAIAIDKECRTNLEAEALRLTNLANPNSVAQLRKWIEAETGNEVATLRKADIPELLKNTDCEVVTRVLRIRQEMSKTSVKKYEAMQAAICADNRARGLMQYYGANRTGRWAGRLIQVQNLPQNHLADLELARETVREEDTSSVELLYGNVPDTLSQLIRTSFVAPEGHRFIVADFSAIEARVIAWLAGEKWRLAVFNSHGKIYEASASQMFKVPIDSITKGSDLRQKGKVAELALGYQGGPGALISMGALNMGLKEEELPALVKMWRNANRKITGLWNAANSAAIESIEHAKQVPLHNNKAFTKCSFSVSNSALFFHLPSGRMLVYQSPKLGEGQYGKLITYMGMSQTSKKWERAETYGGKLVENIVQAIARDCLADAMLRLDAAGYKIVMHVHDEVVLEVPESFGSVEEVCGIMGKPISWAKGLPLRAEGYETKFYKKD